MVRKKSTAQKEAKVFSKVDFLGVAILILGIIMLGIGVFLSLEIAGIVGAVAIMIALTILGFSF